MSPGNVGIFQLAYAATAVAFGLDKDQAIAVALLIQAQQIIPVTVLGVASRRSSFSRRPSGGTTMHPATFPANHAATSSCARASVRVRIALSSAKRVAPADTAHGKCLSRPHRQG